MTDESLIREKLLEVCSQRGSRAEIAKSFEVSQSTVKRWVEGAEIPPPMLKLLDWYFFGTMPPRLSGNAPVDMDSTLDFDEAEWRIIGHIARRQGITEAEWIVRRIRDYLAILAEQSENPTATMGNGLAPLSNGHAEKAKRIS